MNIIKELFESLILGILIIIGSVGIFFIFAYIIFMLFN